MQAGGGSNGTIGRQYAAWPYPQVSLLANVDSTHPWQLHCDAIWDRCGSGKAPSRPRIWIAGCGTFQPYVFSVANPRAEIVATDLSEPSLKIAKKRCQIHRARNVAFQRCDLEDESTWPDGEFDLIECYGVLMNLRDPQRALAALRNRLSPRGVLRLMVYPQFSRARVFQLQRVAKLCGFHAGDRTHPSRFRALVKALPKSHPLRFALTSYADSKNDAGIVDAYLHAGDRGFTGWQLGALLQQAGLVPAHWMHRPWAQPDVAAERLSMQARSQSFVLGYLDLWQELRQNFVVCCTREDMASGVTAPLRPHPTFTGKPASLRHAMRLLRLRLLGGRVPTRTGDGDVVLRARDARALASGDAATREDFARLRAEGLVLGGDAEPCPLRDHVEIAGEADWLRSTSALRIGRRAPNPLYAHLFAAFEANRAWPQLGLPSLDEQLRAWLPWATPLEHGRIRFGLTPYATAQRCQAALKDHLDREPLPIAANWSEVRLREDQAKLAESRAFAAANGVDGALVDDRDARELWCLLFAQDDPFLTLLPA